jgi:hypothetical protein
MRGGLFVNHLHERDDHSVEHRGGFAVGHAKPRSGRMIASPPDGAGQGNIAVFGCQTNA